MGEKIDVVQFDPNERKDQTIDLYEKRAKIYTRYIDGPFQRLRNVTIIITIGAYLLGPWITWNGRQAVLFDLPAREFHIFGYTFWPQDFVLLSWLLIIAALGLFFITALAGRVYCGYVCPQTVWTRIFIWIEHFTEGDRNKRMKLDKAGLSAAKAWKKVAKHSLWLLVAFLTSYTFVGYFVPIRELSIDLATLSVGGWALFWLFFFTAATYLNAGWMREQVCMYMCPYARFQSAMFDRDTLIVTYDEERGEPRGARKKTVDPQQAGLGDCVDCSLCVQVCPTGIDIREGLQYECIGCAACIDACNQIMDKMGYDHGLIRYSTENAMETKKIHVLRPRMIVYSVLLAIMTGLFLFTLFTRVPMEMDVIKDRNQLFRYNDQGLVENVYTLKLINMSQQPQQYQIRAEGIEGLQLAGDTQVMVNAGEVLSIPLRVMVAEENLEQSNYTIHFIAQSTTDENLKVDEESRFIGPM